MLLFCISVVLCCSVVSCCFVRHVLLGRVCFVGDFLLCVFCLYFIFRGVGVFLVLLHLGGWGHVSVTFKGNQQNQYLK